MKQQNSHYSRGTADQGNMHIPCLFICGREKFPSSMHCKQVKTNLNMAAQSLNRLDAQDKLLVSP